MGLSHHSHLTLSSLPPHSLITLTWGLSHHSPPHQTLHPLSTMKIAAILLSVLLTTVLAADTKTDTKGLACDICMDVIGDLDNFLTDDTTQEEILNFVKELCHLLGQLLGENFENQCNAMFDENLPAIIDAIVDDSLDPNEICTMITACP